jgi:Anthrone oxygenase
MNDVWAIMMMISGGLFAGGVVSIAWERSPAWRTMPPADFRTGFVNTLRRVDRLQPALLSICLASTIGFAITSAEDARVFGAVAAAGFFLILVGSVAWLIPIQRTVKSGSELSLDDVDELRTRWLRGHLIRTVAAVVLFILAVVTVFA